MYNILLNKCLLCTTQNNPGPENSWTRNILRGKWFPKKKEKKRQTCRTATCASRSKKEKKKDKLVGPPLALRGQKYVSNKP